MTPISEFLWATDKDPRITTKLVDLPFTVDEKGAHFVRLKHEFNFVWLQFRHRRPELTGDPWDSTKFYQAGDQVYFVNSRGVGNFYNALVDILSDQNPDIFPDKWAVVALPYFLRQYLIHGAYADWLVQDGQTDKADTEEARAMAYLELEADKLQRQGGQVRRLAWKG